MRVLPGLVIQRDLGSVLVLLDYRAYDGSCAVNVIINPGALRCLVALGFLEPVELYLSGSQFWDG